MKALVRESDRAIIGVDQITGWAGGVPTVLPVAAREGCALVDISDAAYAHWWSLTLPAGEVMALGDDGTISVLEYAPPDPALAAAAQELRELARTHPALAKVLAGRAGISLEETP